MKPVTQEEPVGCAVACVACVCEISYKEAKKLFPNSEDASGQGYWCKDIVNALCRFGLTYKWKKARHDTKYQERSIVFIDYSKKYPIGHYLVRTKNNWMDPWLNFPSIVPAKAGFVKKLSGKVGYYIYPIKKVKS